MNIYNSIIIGGGVSGLYLNYKLLKKNKGKTLLLEKNDYLGGRILTYRVKMKKNTYQMEGGAGRFSINHKLLIKLIKEFKLEKYIYSIPSTSRLSIVSKKLLQDEISKYTPYQIFDYIFNKTKLTNYHRKFTLREFLKKNYKKNIVDYLEKTYPYSDIFQGNCYDVIFLYKKDLNEKNKFFILTCGFDKIIDKLKYEIIKMGGIIKMNEELKKIINVEQKNIIKTNKDVYFCNSVIAAIQKPDLNKIDIFNNVGMINSITNSKLLRIYAIFDTKKCTWFKNIPKTITDSKISYFIPIDYESGLTMISYTDEKNTEYLMNLKKNMGRHKMMEFILKECEKVFKIKNIEKPTWFKCFYWENGVGNWKKNINSTKVSKSILKPFKQKEIFICGENYSKNFQAWIEGSLETAESVLKLI